MGNHVTTTHHHGNYKYFKSFDFGVTRRLESVLDPLYPHSRIKLLNKVSNAVPVLFFQVLEAELVNIRAGVKNEMTHSSTYKELFLGKQYRRANIVAAGKNRIRH